MQRGSTRLLGAIGAIFLLFWAGAVGCGHATFDFMSDEANMNSGSGGGSPPTVGSGGTVPTGSGGAPYFPASGGISAGGEGGTPGCVGPGCPELPCCKEIDAFCGPFDGFCSYCSHPDQCLPGTRCDPLTKQCMVECDDDFDCPEGARLCDEQRGVCIQCYENVHCRGRDMHCVPGGFCVACDDECF